MAWKGPVTLEKAVLDERVYENAHGHKCLERSKLVTGTCTRIDNEPGVYKILAPEKPWPNGIPRVKGTDTERVLAFGSSTKLQTRICEFFRCMVRPGGHHEGNLLRMLNDHAGFQITCVDVYWKIIDGHEDEEGRLIKKYVKKFGEVPPLNAAIPKRERDDYWE